MDLVETWLAGTRLFRARRDDGVRPLTTARDFGPPTVAHAVADRFAPAGHPKFHGACERELAVASLAATGAVAVATFELVRPATILNLATIRRERTSPAFRALWAYAADIARERVRDLELAQRFTAALRTQYADAALDGIAYATDLPCGGRNVVIFAGQDAVAALLRLTNVERVAN